MNNMQRFMVRGKTILDGEYIEGYIAPHNRSEPTAGQWYIVVDDPDAGYHYSANVDPATVEPVAVPLKREHTAVGEHRCPSCNAAFIDEFGRSNYCGNCGQRLDWPEVTA